MHHLKELKNISWNLSVNLGNISLTLGLQKSVSVKNKLLTNFINEKDPILKEECHTNYKKYRNLLSTLMKKSKQTYYDRYFEKD